MWYGLTHWAMNYINGSNNENYAWFINWMGSIAYDFNRTDIRALKPVINLNPNISIKSGTGTLNDPYVLNY